MARPETFDRRALLGLAGTGLAALAVTAFARSQPPRHKFEVALSDDEWLRRLGRDRFRILRRGGTERPYSSPLNDEHRRGTFVCAGCRLPLFRSAAKFDSGTGWPSFVSPMPNAVATRRDGSLGMVRTEVLCRRCGGHLGHVFNDGPKPTGLRYCINGLALRFIPA